MHTKENWFLFFCLTVYIYTLLFMSGISQNTHTHLAALCPGLPSWAGTRKANQTGFYWSKRQWVAVASAGPYASLHLAPDRQPCQHPTTQFFTGRMPFLPPNQQRQSTEGSVRNLSACKCKSKRKPQNIWKIIRLKSLQVRTVSSQSSFVVCFCCICVVKNCGKIKKNSSSVDSLLLLISVM